MDKNKEEMNKLLSILAQSMDSQVIEWNNVEETISEGITISKLVDTSSYISQEDNKKLVLKSNIY